MDKWDPSIPKKSWSPFLSYTYSWYIFLTQTHYLFQILKLVKGAKEASERLNDLGRRLFLYGVACLFSVNFLQSSVVGAIIAWLILICMIIAHCFVFLKETGQKYHNICLLIYYSLLAVWFALSLFFFISDAVSA